MTKVTIYTTPSCVYCRMAKEFFKEKNIDYTEIDVSANHEAAHEMIEKSGQMGVPVVVVEKEGKEELIIGFNKERLSQLLGVS